mmetsp:Transcript_32119/g.44531  ORF Transcript_32119/g.44531 Transcript_32119/m.44531 type:complete len:247 (+) Transcript_32119:285-1025(+)|eukprot:CAMPEP_0196577964 /NCGR_PEP_ID=MMETSP1081-20130531/6952_1 /TAXON_ID=36882 /ORGANISM="Pyramimonas amylifera, Strain CCMP720" /LENGTH=246 /DNA_ID=CAMNT_0041897041 /DNA_START=283 /DNA_END=1023 /DNA_ORIENTATION=-
MTDNVVSEAREDGRLDNQIRTLACERGLLARADGSARWTQDQSSVVCAVYGPRAVPGYKEDPEQATLEVTLRPKNQLPGMAETEFEKVLAGTLRSIIITSMHPRTAISVVLQILACCINSACAALVDAGIALTGLVSAVSLMLRPDGGLLLDPTLSETKEARARVTMAFSRTKALPPAPLETKGETEKAKEVKEPALVVTSVTNGSLTVEEYFVVSDVARTACEQVGAFFELSLQKYQRGWQMFSK